MQRPKRQLTLAKQLSENHLAKAKSAAAQRLRDDQLSIVLPGLRQIANLFAAEEEKTVRPYPLPLVDHAKTNDWVATV